MADADANALSFKLKLSQIVTSEQIDEFLDLFGRPSGEGGVMTSLVRSLRQDNPTSLGL